MPLPPHRVAREWSSALRSRAVLPRRHQPLAAEVSGRAGLVCAAVVPGMESGSSTAVSVGAASRRRPAWRRGLAASPVGRRRVDRDDAAAVVRVAR